MYENIFTIESICKRNYSKIIKSKQAFKKLNNNKKTK